MRNTITLKFKRKQIKCRFGLGFIGEFIEDNNIDVDELMHKVRTNPFKVVPQLIHGSAKYEALRRGKAFTYEIWDIVDMLDEDGAFESENFLKFIEAFSDSMSKNVPQDDEKPLTNNENDENDEQTDEKKS